MAVQVWTSTAGGFETTPAGNTSASEGDDRIRELKETAGALLDKEHAARDQANVASQGWHREGSAIAYYEASAPTNRPDGATALSTTDAGRLWIDSDDGTLDYWDGSAWQDAITDQSLLTTDDVTFNTVAVTGNATVGGALAVTGTFAVTGSATFGSVAGPMRATNILHTTNPTQDDVFAALSAAVPTTGNIVIVSGAGSYSASTGGRHYLYAWTHAERVSSTAIVLRGAAILTLDPTETSAASALGATYSVNSGSTSILFDFLSIAW